MNNQNELFSIYDAIIVQDSPIHGRGVFATKNIMEGTLIERCPMLKLDFPSKYHCDLKILDYAFARPSDSPWQDHGWDLYLIMGYGMLYNHQDIPSASITFNYDLNYADITATKDILSGSEICISYGPLYFMNKIGRAHV